MRFSFASGGDGYYSYWVMAEPRGRSQESAGQLRQRRLRAEWRGVYEPPDLSKFERRIDDVVGRIMQRAGLDHRLAEETVIREWASMVGDFLAAQSRPTGLRNGVLSVAVLQASVRYDLERNLKREILRRLQVRFGKSIIADLRFLPS